MTIKICLLIRTVMFIFLLLVLWNIFSFMKFNHSQKVSLGKSVLRSTHSPELIKAGTQLDFLKSEEVPDVLFNKRPQLIHIVAVVCGERINETLVLIKSALITCRSDIRFILFTDEAATSTLNRVLNLWPKEILKRLQMDLRPITFPAEKTDEWRKLFKPCASQRLFLPVSNQLSKSLQQYV